MMLCEKKVTIICKIPFVFVVTFLILYSFQSLWGSQYTMGSAQKFYLYFTYTEMEEFCDYMVNGWPKEGTSLHAKFIEQLKKVNALIEHDKKKEDVINCFRRVRSKYIHSLKKVPSRFRYENSSQENVFNV